MRAYFFTNMYLSSIQQGIQPLHCLVELMLAPWPDHVAGIVADWAENHKTVICLNGGPAGSIAEIYDRLKHLGKDLDLPYGFFCEDEWSLSGTMTTCGIIVPESIYGAAKQLRVSGNDSELLQLFSKAELALARLLNEFPLAH